MESIAALLIMCSTPLVFAFLGALGGFIGGKTSSKVLQELDPALSKETRARIVKRSTLGFLAGTLIGGVPLGIGLSFTFVTPFANLSYHWAVFVALGFALMGVIGTIVAGSALFSRS